MFPSPFKMEAKRTISFLNCATARAITCKLNQLNWNEIFEMSNKMCPYIYEEKLRHQPHFSRKWRALFGGGKKCCHNASITGGGLQKGWAQCSNKGGGWVSQVQGPISGLTDPSWTPEYPTGPLDGQPLEAEYGPDTDFSFGLHYKLRQEYGQELIETFCIILHFSSDKRSALIGGIKGTRKISFKTIAFP